MSRLLLKILLSAAVLTLGACGSHYGTRYGDAGQAVYVCPYEGHPSEGRAILTASDCAEPARDYIVLTDDGGVLSSFTVYLDLCDDYKVTVVGGYEVVGHPPFYHEWLGWYEHGLQRDSLERVYSADACRHRLIL